LLNFAPIANLPQTFFQGNQNARTLALQQPVIDPNTGQPTNDPNAIIAAANQRGGLESAIQLLPAEQRQQFLDYLRSQNGDQETSPAPQRPTSYTGGPTGPAGIRGPSAQPAAAAQPSASSPPAQPTLSTFGADDGGQSTLRSVMTETFGGRDVSPIIPRVAAALKIDPDAPLSPGQMTQAKTLLTRIQASGVQAGNQAQPSDTTGGGAQVTPVGGTGGNGAPTQGTTPETASPATGIQPNGPGARPTPSADAIVPPSYRGQPLQYALQQDQIANALDNRAQQAQVLGYDAKGLTDQAAAARARAQSVREALAKDTGQTPEEMNLTRGVTARNKEVENEVTQSQKTYNGMQAQSTQYERDLKPVLDISQSLLSDPRMYTGAFGDLSLKANRLRALAGGDPNAAILQEALQKVTATSVLAQINAQKDQLQEAGGTASRIFQSQVEQVTKAAPSMETTKGGNRFLVEVAHRTGEQASTVTQMAQNYINAHGHLDPAFDQQLSSYIKAHPIFSKQEMTNPALLGSPTLPPALKTPQQVQAWAQAMQLQPGEFIHRNGEYFKVPRITVPLGDRLQPGAAQAASAPQQGAP
jgi:hypothetical protein